MKKNANKPVPDSTVYLTKNGTRVRVTKGKQFPVHPADPFWRQEMQRKSNEESIAVVRISDGHELWGYTKADLVVERS